jgi:hypothetical protein
MRVPASRPSARARARLASAVTLAAILAGCGGSAPSAAPPIGTASVIPSQGVAVVTAAQSVSTVPASVAASPTAMLPAPTALTLAWQKAAPETGNTATYWPAVDPVTGNVWVASPWENDFWVFKPDGTFVERWGTAGSGNGQFHLTTHDQVHSDADGAVAFAPDGSFYVADGGNNRIEQFDTHRHFVRAWGSFGNGDGQFTSPKGIATDGKTVFVADDYRGDMQTFDATGRHLATFTFPFVLFSLRPNGDVQTMNQEFDPSGQLVKAIPVDFQAFGGNPAMAVTDKAGSVYVGLQTDADGAVGLIKLDPTGRVLAHWTTGAETMALSPDGRSMYMAYTGPPNGLGWPYLRKYTLP